MLSKTFERPRLAALTLVVSVTLLALLVYQLTLRRELTSQFTIPEPPALPSLLPSSRNNYTAAIIYLAERDRLDDTIHSLGSLQLYIPWRVQWPIILFHTGDFENHDVLSEFYTKLEKDKWTKGLHSQLRKRIQFVRIDFTFPPGVSPDINVYNPEEFDWRWPGEHTHVLSVPVNVLSFTKRVCFTAPSLGYHHMCRFYAEQIFHHPRIRNLTYYMRMDTDSFIMKPLCYDPIEHVHHRNRVYAYNRITPDEGYVVRGMWNFIDRYARSHPGVDDQLRRNKWPWPQGRDRWIADGIKYDGIGVPAYSNNFEIVRLKAFQRRDVVQFIREIMWDPGHIYSLRWGKYSSFL